jgi:hypothetical protein
MEYYTAMKINKAYINMGKFQKCKQNNKKVTEVNEGYI